jgi:hypothetical protein
VTIKFSTIPTVPIPSAETPKNQAGIPPNLTPTMYAIVKIKPVTIPAIAPSLLVRLSKIPRMIAGKKLEAANPKPALYKKNYG